MSSIRDKIDPAFTNLPAMDFDTYATVTEQKGVTPMSWADPFFSEPCVPAHIIDAVKQALDTGKTHYTVPNGSRVLRRLIAEKLKAFNKIDADPDTEIIITPGSDTGLYHAMRPFLVYGNGDEVLIPDPSYRSNFENTKLMGGIPVSVPLREENAFQFDIADFEARFTDKTKLVVLTHPNNPTTTVFTRANLMQLSQFVVEHDLALVVDQVFESAVFDGREFVTPAALPGMRERTVTVFSTSKSMGLCGFRVGYNAACADIMRVMHASAVNILGATNTFAQAGAVAAFENDAFIGEFNAIFDRRRKAAYTCFNSIPGVRCLMPEATFLIWVDVASLGTSVDIARYLLERAQVAVSTGDTWGNNGEGYIRVNIAIRDDAVFSDALARIKAALTKLAAKRGLCPAI